MVYKFTFQPAVRVKVRRGIFGTISKAVDDARYLIYKDSDETFHAIREHNEEMVKYSKNVALHFQKVTDDEKSKKIFQIYNF